MKAVAYTALILSIIALALGIYAFTGGFSGAGTALISAPSKNSTAAPLTSTTSSIANLLPAGVSKYRGNIGLVTNDTTNALGVVLKDKTGAPLATYGVARIVQFDNNIIRTIALYTAKITVDANAVRKLAPIVVASGTTPTADASAAERDTYARQIAAAATANFDMASFTIALKKAVGARSSDTVQTYGVDDINVPLVLSNPNTLVLGTTDNPMQQFLLEVAKIGGGCDSQGGCK